VVDLGCGYGRVAGEFLQRGFDYTGIDVSPDAIEQARREHPEGDFFVMDLNDWSGARTFDVVCVFYVFVHFVDDSNWSSFLNHALSSVASNGYFVFADQFTSERTAAGAHVVSRPLSSYTPRLLELGFDYDAEMKAAFVERAGTKVAEQFHFAHRTS
jgi:SAM-dependent methyltransferase